MKAWILKVILSSGINHDAPYRKQVHVFAFFHYESLLIIYVMLASFRIYLGPSCFLAKSLTTYDE
jgi:hypothetical protein